jgi:hypothetical protein
MISSGKCALCGAILHGRCDKKFCDDQCRSSYNNRSYANDRKSVKAINRILLSNRKILKHAIDEYGHKASWSKLIALGFDPRYCTEANLKEGSPHAFYCYEYAWQRKGNWVEMSYHKKGEN